jgi:hypothetical protein
MEFPIYSLVRGRSNFNAGRLGMVLGFHGRSIAGRIYLIFDFKAGQVVHDYPVNWKVISESR